MWEKHVMLQTGKTLRIHLECLLGVLGGQVAKNMCDGGPPGEYGGASTKNHTRNSNKKQVAHAPPSLQLPAEEESKRKLGLKCGEHQCISWGTMIDHDLGAKNAPPGRGRGQRQDHHRPYPVHLLEKRTL